MRKPIPRAYVIAGLMILAWLVVICLVLVGLEIFNLTSSVVVSH